MTNNESRPAIPADIYRKVLIEAGHRCAIPTCQHTEIDVHHIIPWETCKKHEYENLIALCPNCHRRAHKNNEIDRKSLKLYKKNLTDKLSPTQTVDTNIITLLSDNELTNINIFLMKYEKVIPRDYVLNLSKFFQELTLNSKEWGFADTITLEKKANKIIFIDNGNAFNPLLELEKSSQGGYVTVDYCKDIYKKIKFEYTYANEKNIISLEIDIDAFNNSMDCVLKNVAHMPRYMTKDIQDQLQKILDSDCKEVVIDLTDMSPCMSTLLGGFPNLFQNIQKTKKEIDIKLLINKNDKFIQKIINKHLQEILEEYNVEVKSI